jgi:uncharacterized protein involved in exopolysaccharide biosynthesis
MNSNAVRLASDDGGFDELVVRALRYWRLAVLVTVSFAALAIILAFVLPKSYEAQTVLVPTINESRIQSGAASASGDSVGALASRFGLGGLRSSSDGGPEVIATVQSQSFVEEFIRDKGLLPSLFADRWDANAKRWNVPEDEVPTLATGYQRFTEDVLDVRSDLQTGLVTLRIEWRDPHVAAQWANELVARTNQRMRSRALEEAQRSLDYLNSELGKSQRLEVQQSLYRLVEANLTQLSVASGRTEYAFRIIDPAFAPELKNFSKPNRLAIIAVGVLFGGFLGTMAALMAAVFSGVRANAR